MGRGMAVLRRATTLVERLAGPRTTQRLLLAMARGIDFWTESLRRNRLNGRAFPF